MPYEDLRRRQRVRDLERRGESLRRYVHSLLKVAERNLTGARIDANPLDIRHNLAYDAARSAAEAMMAAEGLRHGPGADAHVMVFEYLAIADERRFEREADYFTRRRRLRNMTQYEVADLITQPEVTVILRRATQLLADVRQWIAQHHPELTDEASTVAEDHHTDQG